MGTRRKLINSQISNFQTYIMNRNRMIDLAENVIKKKNLPIYIDESYVNKILLSEGSICFFVDEVMGLLALPWRSMAGLDVYGRPRRVQCYGQNGYHSKILTQNQFVIMYDNSGKRSLYSMVCQYAERYSNAVRTQDINIGQQKTNRIWKTASGQEQSVSDLLNNIDGNVENVITYDGLDITETQSVLSVAPYVADKIDEYKANLWNEFLGAIGISNININKKERLIKDEVLTQMGGTVAMRNVRFEAQKKAVDEINTKFSDWLEKPIEISFYDGEPSSEDDTSSEDDNISESEAIENANWFWYYNWKS